ncbi:ribosomal protein S18-alanine N-acetyltransferase [Paucilactobacillus sp. N302-9]
MFVKFKKWLKDGRQRRRKDEIADALAIKNAIVDINDVDYFIARAQITDVPEILQVEQQIYGATPWNENAFVQEIRRKRDRLYLVVRKNDMLIGFVGCSFDRVHNESHITNIAITPAYQNKGIGRYLLQYLLKISAAVDMHVISLEVRISNENAQRLYRKMGFLKRKIKKGYYLGDHEDALEMVLDLSYLKEQD